MPTSLVSLRLAARQRADQENSEFVSDTELTGYLQDSYGELYDLLTSKNQDYYLADPYQFTLVGTSKQALPADFYKLLGVDCSLGGSWRELEPFNFNERNLGTRCLIGRRAVMRYRVMGSSLYFTPENSADGTYRLWYYPTCPDLEAAGALDATADRWREYIVVDAAIKMLAKEESDTSQLERTKMGLMRRIEELSAERDVGRSGRITDVRGAMFDDEDY